MRVALVCSASCQPALAGIVTSLTQRGHQVDVHAPDVTAETVGGVGHGLADQLAITDRPDVVLGLGAEAGLAGQLATRDTPVPAAVRLSRVGRTPLDDADRLSVAVARHAALVLVPSVGELDRLADLGVRRDRLTVVPEAVDRARFRDSNPPDQVEGPLRIGILAGQSETAGVVQPFVALGTCVAVALDPCGGDEALAAALRSTHAVLVTDDTDAEVGLVLRAMSCGRPVVAAEHGILTDLVADGVTGLLAPKDSLTEALRSLAADPLRRISLGLAGVDRVAARFTTEVVGAALDRALQQLIRAATPPGPEADNAPDPADWPDLADISGSAGSANAGEEVGV